MRGSVNSFSPGKFARLALLSSADRFLVFPYLSKRAGSGPGWVALLAGASSRYAKVSDSTSGPVRAHTRVNPRMHPYVEQQVHGSLSQINSKKNIRNLTAMLVVGLEISLLAVAPHFPTTVSPLPAPLRREASSRKSRLRAHAPAL